MKMPEDEINIELDLDFDEIDRKVKAFTDRVFGDYNAFYRALSDDWKESRDLLAANDTPFARRTYLRSLFLRVSRRRIVGRKKNCARIFGRTREPAWVAWRFDLCGVCVA